MIPETMILTSGLHCMSHSQEAESRACESASSHLIKKKSVVTAKQCQASCILDVHVQNGLVQKTQTEVAFLSMKRETSILFNLCGRELLI